MNTAKEIVRQSSNAMAAPPLLGASSIRTVL
jgi:hypothetical protein